MSLFQPGSCLAGYHWDMEERLGIGNFVRKGAAIRNSLGEDNKYMG